MSSVSFVSRWDFKKLLRDNYVNENVSVVSISDTIHEEKEMGMNLSFFGILPEKSFLTHFPDNERGIDKHVAKELVDFIKAQGDTNFIVHCFMGISRSAAVAKFINEYYDMGDIVLNTYAGYNRQVYNSLNAVIGKDIAAYYVEIEKNQNKG